MHGWRKKHLTTSHDPWWFYSKNKWNQFKSYKKPSMHSLVKKCVWLSQLFCWVTATRVISSGKQNGASAACAELHNARLGNGCVHDLDFLSVEVLVWTPPLLRIWILQQSGIWVVVSNIFYFHPYLGKWSHLTNIFQMGWNHQLGIVFGIFTLLSRLFAYTSWLLEGSYLELGVPEISSY